MRQPIRLLLTSCLLLASGLAAVAPGAAAVGAATASEVVEPGAIPVVARSEAERQLLSTAQLEQRAVHPGDRAIAEAARSRPTFGGAYVDGDGTIVIQVAGSTDAMRRSLDLSDGESIRFERVEYSESELQERAAALFASLNSRVKVTSIHIDHQARSFVIEVDEQHLARLQDLLQRPDIADTLDIPLEIWTGPAGGDDACTSRRSCFNPMRPGIRIQPQTNPNRNCAMGWHVALGGGGSGFLMSAHCIMANSDTVWSHGPYGDIGWNDGNLGLYLYNQTDVAMVTMPTDQTRSAPYGISYGVEGSGRPFQGAPVCGSLANVGANRCGTVVASWAVWTSNICGCTQYGARHNLSAQNGDSGSPIWELPHPQRRQITAVGIHSNAGTYFSYIDLALQYYNATVK